jgi:integrase/recombinase XerD
VRQLEVLTEEQVAAIFRCRHLTGNSAVAKRNRALISLLLDSGLRLAEVVGIDDANLFLQAEWVRVVGKGNRERLAPFSAITRAALEASIAARDAEPIAVTGPAGGKTFELGREGVRRVIERIGADTGLRLHCHLFRHTSATTMIKRGMDVATLQKILGHSSIAITQVYLHLRQEEIKEKHTAFSPMDHFMPAPLPKKRRSLGRRAA